MRDDWLPGDGSIAAIRADHEDDRRKRVSNPGLVSPYQFARVRALLAEYDRRATELLAANTREVERRRKAENALRTVLARITGTLAEHWVAPNPTASQISAGAQYPGTLADFIRQALDA